ncbi:hypothetical protein [Microcystis aeruginosa]|nr:hypothetical protein [Microcystis aeruginosa]
MREGVGFSGVRGAIGKIDIHYNYQSDRCLSKLKRTIKLAIDGRDQ